jgi:tetratricopeptide (TPR) repeat protein
MKQESHLSASIKENTSPTKRQLYLCSSLGIPLPENPTKDNLATLISQALAKQRGGNAAAKQNAGNQQDPNISSDDKSQTIHSRWKEGAVQSIKSGEYKKAIVALTHAIKSEPNNNSLYYYRAVAYSKINETTQALKDLQKAASMGNMKARKYLEGFLEKK